MPSATSRTNSVADHPDDRPTRWSVISRSHSQARPSGERRRRISSRRAVRRVHQCGPIRDCRQALYRTIVHPGPRLSATKFRTVVLPDPHGPSRCTRNDRSRPSSCRRSSRTANASANGIRRSRSSRYVSPGTSSCNSTRSDTTGPAGSTGPTASGARTWTPPSPHRPTIRVSPRLPMAATRAPTSAMLDRALLGDERDPTVLPADDHRRSAPGWQVQGGDLPDAAVDRSAGPCPKPDRSRGPSPRRSRRGPGRSPAARSAPPAGSPTPVTTRGCRTTGGRRPGGRRAPSAGGRRRCWRRCTAGSTPGHVTRLQTGDWPWVSTVVTVGAG